MREWGCAGTRKRRGACLLLVAGVVLFHAVCTMRYLAGDLYLRQKDVAAHLKVCTKYLLQSRDVLREDAPVRERLAGLASLFHQRSIPVEHIWIWPRLTYLVTAPVAALAGLTPRVIIFSNVIWLAVLLFSVYFIGERSLSPAAGLASALVTSLLPATYGLSRNFGLDFPLMAMTALGIYWLIRTENFSRRLPSLALGCVVGMGLLVKMQLVIFIAIPVLYAFASGVLRPFTRGARRGGVLLNALIAAGAALLLSSPFWWGNVGNIVTVFVRHAEAREGIDPHNVILPLASVRSVAYYAAAATVYISPPLCALGVLLLAPFLHSRFREKAIVLLWGLGPYFLFTLIELKYSVFYLPALPAAGCVIGAGLASLAPGALKRSLYAAAIGWGLFQFAQLSFGLGPAPYRGCRLYASDALRSDGYPVWAHPAFPNNVERVAHRFIGEIDRREAGNRYVRIGICELDYSAEDYLLVDSFEYFMEAANPGIYAYRSYFASDSFLECMDSFNYLVVLEKGDKPAADFRGIREYFTEGQGAWLAGKILKDRDTVARLIDGYRRYELLDRAVLSPDGVGAFLMRKPPFPVGADAVIPATHVAGTNVLIAYPLIGVDDRLRRLPTIGDYDVLFPYDLDFPLVPPAPRNPREEYYAAYRLFFEEGGSYSLLARAEGGDPALLGAVFNGMPVVRPTSQAASGEGFLGMFRAVRGEGELRLTGTGGFPVLRQVRLRRTGP